MDKVCLNAQCSLCGLRRFDGAVWEKCPGCLELLYGMAGVVPVDPQLDAVRGTNTVGDPGYTSVLLSNEIKTCARCGGRIDAPPAAMIICTCDGKPG